MDVWTPWRGQPDTTRRVFAVLLVCSVLLHLPFTPFGALLDALRGLTDAGDPLPNGPPLTTIPFDLIEDDSLTAPSPNEAPPPAPPPEAPPAAPEAPDPEGLLDGGVADAGVVDAGRKEPERDAGPRDAAVEDGAVEDGAVDDAGSEEGGLDAGLGDAGLEDASAEAGAPEDAGPEDAGPVSDAGAKDGGLADPIALRGAERKVADPNANVQLRLYNARIRKHPLGPRIGRLLGSIYQWRDFFGPTGLDPIRDVDQVLVLGSQFRDSSGVVAFLKLNVPDERVRLAVDALVQSDPEGGWLDAGVPQATARADRAPRVFTLPSPGIVVVTPPGSVAESAAQIPRNYTLREGKGDEVASAVVKTPWRALRGIFAVPKTISVARLRVTPTPARGAVIDIEADDESVEQASQDATYLANAVTAATQLSVLGFTTRFVERVEFSAQGSTIIGRLVLNEQQLLTVLDFAEAYVVPPRRSDAGVDAGGR